MRRVRIVAGVAVFVAVVLSWLWIFTLFPRLYIYFQRDHYRVESFEVTGTVSPSSRRGFRAHWLAGTVAGKIEKVRPELPPGFKSERTDDLLSLFPLGSTVPVLYHPDAPEIMIQGEALRVLHFTPDFWRKENRLRTKLLCFVLLPVPLTVAFYRYAKKRW
jgi:4-amino-4-deoxy-L-arabinose transferase-like glycosyltransferase